MCIHKLFSWSCFFYSWCCYFYLQCYVYSLHSCQLTLCSFSNFCVQIHCIVYSWYMFLYTFLSWCCYDYSWYFCFSICLCHDSVLFFMTFVSPFTVTMMLFCLFLIVSVHIVRFSSCLRLFSTCKNDCSEHVLPIPQSSLNVKVTNPFSCHEEYWVYEAKPIFLDKSVLSRWCSQKSSWLRSLPIKFPWTLRLLAAVA